jgi:hypothetical protein
MAARRRVDPGKDSPGRCETVETVDRKTRDGSREERARAFVTAKRNKRLQFILLSFDSEIIANE